MSVELDRMVAQGTLTRLSASAKELLAHRAYGRAKLTDAANPHLSLESRFTLAYGAVHSLALAALRAAGYRPVNARQATLLTLPHTAPVSRQAMAVVSLASERRNDFEYLGELRVDLKFVNELIAAGVEIERQLPNP